MKETFKTLLLAILTLTFGCKQKAPKDFSDLKAGKENAIASLKNKLIGKWGGLNETHPVWKITSDSIHYYQTDLTYPYEIKGDTFYVKFPDSDSSTAFGTISVLNDTLKIVQYKNAGFVVSGYRFK